MKVIGKTGNEKIATVYIAELDDGSLIEFVESIQPPLMITDKWVLIISTLKGCPVQCRFCDAGGYYKGPLSYEDLLFQIDFLIRQKFPSLIVPSKKFKIQFARMGEPTFNQHVLDLLENLPSHIQSHRLIPSLSTVAPLGTEGFFERLLDIKNRLYLHRFQLQFSLHSTSEATRSKLIPIRKWEFEQIAEYGSVFADQKKAASRKGSRF